MELTLKKLDDLDLKFKDFKEKIETTDHQYTRETVDFLDKHRPNKAFQYWALMMLQKEIDQTHTQNLASEIWELKDQINELLGRGYEVIQERNELLEAVKTHLPEWQSKLLWCVEIAEEPDSPFEQIPASSKDVAQRAVKRYHKMHNNAYENKDLVCLMNDSIQVHLWHSTEEEFNKASAEFVFDEAWFELPMYDCNSIDQIDLTFKYGDLVECKNGGQVLITKDIEEAKRFFGVA